MGKKEKRKIANRIVQERNKRKIKTLELAEIIRTIVPKNLKKDPTQELSKQLESL